MQWLELHGTCPVSRTKLTNHTLVPNLGIKQAVQSWLQQALQSPVPPNM